MKKILLGILIAFIISPNPISEMAVTIPEPAVVRVDQRAATIDQYFKNHSMPLAGEGVDFVAAADRAEIDYRLLPAIAVRESSGGLHMPYQSFNAWGWNSGGYAFQSFKAGIDLISDKLGRGNLYTGKTLRQKLEVYNPPSVLPTYAEEVIKIMSDIDATPLSPTEGYTPN